MLVLMKPPVCRLIHSAKGSTWDDHKYLKRIDGTYYYPDSYEGGRHLSDLKKDSKSKESDSDDRKKKIMEQLARTKDANSSARYDFGQMLFRAGIDINSMSKEEVDRLQREIVSEIESGGESKLSEKDIDNLAKEVKKGNFGDGDVRRELLGEYYEEVQAKVTELMKSEVGKKKISEVKEEVIEEGEKAVKKATAKKSSKAAKTIDMEQIYSVYRKGKQ